MITLASVSKIYRTTTIETVALNDLNLKIEKGEFVSIMGPSGCGKTTLLNIMGVLDTPTQGTITINGVDIDGLKNKEQAEFRNRNLGFIFQSYHLIRTLTVIENVELPLLYRGISSSKSRQLAEEALERVGLGHKIRMRHFPSQLSGGQCQRVAIARALVGEPKVLLADEPTGNLDSVAGGEIIELLQKLNKEDGQTIVMVTHNEKQARQTYRTIRLLDGKLVV
ncbi:ABC transporter ATP-binding protein [Bacteroides sp. 51]|uniref:ABC transporter ATP-binding protein n=1 Tax=Bacteroides sp. 51 TaxID=2302938 RepID=UPI0013D8A19E|nr:ABC transporter ATP-binding protein [Bacteroides sp. 51]NDV81866.1 ABC transporter ATP-binding protein [Bacteroides sp. 51]